MQAVLSTTLLPVHVLGVPLRAGAASEEDDGEDNNEAGREVGHDDEADTRERALC